MRISDCSSDVCSSDLGLRQRQKLRPVLLGDSKLRQVVGYVLEAELLLRRSWDNQRMAALAEPLIGDADDHDVLHLRQLTDDVLDLDDRDVLAAADHDILRASDDRDVEIGRGTCGEREGQYWSNSGLVVELKK